MLPVFVLNLPRQTERLAQIGGQLDRLGVPWHRIEGVDAATVAPAELDRYTRAQGVLGPMTRGDRGCTASHIKAWQALLETDAAAAVVLEDDVTLSEDFAVFCAAGPWMPSDSRLIKLDKYSAKPSQKLLGKTAHAVGHGRVLRRLCMRHAGGAAYVVTRACAQELLQNMGRISVPVDHFLFSPNVSQIARRRGVYQLVPAAARQDVEAYGSTTAADRRARRKTLGQRLRRLYFELNGLPRQLAQTCMFGARLTTVDYRGSPESDGP